MNVLLVIVDCLRYDHVTKELMPFLYRWGMENTWFTNYWSTSHCTDPAITHMLSGRHPDSLGLYSMMFEHRNYSIPEDVVMLPEKAQSYGHETTFVTNIARWYKRGVQHFIDCRSWPGERIFDAGIQMASAMKTPWFMIVHTDDCHTNYTGGSYDNACKAVDGYIKDLLGNVDQEKTAIFITADHGEGLGEKGIKQHGFGLWDFLTRVPLITNACFDGIEGTLSDPGTLYSMMGHVMDKSPLVFPEHVFQAGDTPPSTRHRGVVYEDGSQYIVESRNGKVFKRMHVIGVEEQKENQTDIAWSERLLAEHCARFGIDFHGEAMEEEVEERLRGIGYFD